MHWAAFVFGWPGALTSIGLSTVGLALKRVELVFVGALVGFPFMFYLFATPRFWPLAVLAIPSHFAAAAALAWRSTAIAWLLFAPTPMVTWYVAMALAGAW